MPRNQRDEPIATATQTYSTADFTIAAPTASAPAACAAMTAGGGSGADGTTPEGAEWDKGRTDLASLKTAIDANNAEIDKLIADDLDLRKAITSIIDALQSHGLIG